MTGEKLYNELAEYYDLIDAKGEDEFKKDVRQITELVKRFKTTANQSLLDVGCGTGRHLSYLENVFSCVGVDANEGVLELARENTRNVAYMQQEMTALDLEDSFGILTCLFSTIGYAQTEENLQETLQRFYDHVDDGGVVIIEPYHQPAEYKLKEGEPTMLTYDGEEVKIARQQIIKTEGRTSIMDIHYLIAERNADEVQYVRDTHRLGLFDQQELIERMEAVGFDSVKRFEQKLTDGAIVGTR